MIRKDSDTKISLEEFVDNIMKEKNHNPRDYCFRLIVSKYPKESHKILNFPGEYVDSLKTHAFTEDGRNLKMDCAQLIMPGGYITCKSTINVEHQTTPLLEEKIGIIYDYKLYLINQTNLPSNSMVITNIDVEEQVIYCESHDQTFKIRYIVLDEEDISKRLSMLTNKITCKDKLTVEEALNITVVVIFVKKEFGKETLEKLAILFSQIDEIELTVQLDIHQVLKKMIKYYFSDDAAKCRELLFVISESIFQENYDGLTYKEVAEIRISELEQEMELQLEKKDDIIFDKELQLEEKDGIIFDKEKTIEKYEEEIKELKKLLYGQKGSI